MKSIAIYARVSSEQQAQEATIDSQVAALKERVAADGHMLLPQDVYLDDGFSGSTLVRPALERLRDRVAEGGIDRLYVHSPDRLARKYAYQVLLLDELRKQGVTTVFLNGPSGKTAEDELLVQVQGMIAEYERAKILERSRRGKIHRARHGEISPLGCAPYGFAYVRKRDGEPASYRVLLHEAKVVRDIFHAVCARAEVDQRHRTRAERAQDPHAPRSRALGPTHGLDDPSQPRAHGPGRIRQERSRQRAAAFASATRSQPGGPAAQAHLGRQVDLDRRARARLARAV